MEGRSICYHSNEQEMEQFWYSDQWVFEPTLQGRRIQCLINENREISFWGKKTSYVKPNLDNKIEHIISDLRKLNFPPNTLLDGYFSIDNNPSALMQFFQFNSTEMTDKLQLEHGKIVYYLTDVIFNNNKDLSFFPLFDRKRALQSLIKENLQFVKIQDSICKAKYENFTQCRDSIQIFTFKNIESLYEFKISSSWKIFKEPLPYFMVLTGFIDGKTDNRQNMVVAFEGSQYRNNVLTKIMNIPVNNTDDMAYCYHNKQKFLSKIFEIKAFEKLKNKYSEARFYCMRNDLSDNVCIFD
jgi:hypothetical protein